jgi:hypothetical protein
MAAFFGEMSFDQTGVQACLAPWVTRPLPAKKSTKVGGLVVTSSSEQFLRALSMEEWAGGFWWVSCGWLDPANVC